MFVRFARRSRVISRSVRRWRWRGRIEAAILNQLKVAVPCPLLICFFFLRTIFVVIHFVQPRKICVPVVEVDGQLAGTSRVPLVNDALVKLIPLLYFTATATEQDLADEFIFGRAMPAIPSFARWIQCWERRWLLSASRGVNSSKICSA